MPKFRKQPSNKVENLVKQQHEERIGMIVKEIIEVVYQKHQVKIPEEMDIVMNLTLKLHEDVIGWTNNLITKVKKLHDKSKPNENQKQEDKE